MTKKIYDEVERQRVRSTLNNEQHAYVIALEKIACAAYHLWKHTTPENRCERSKADDLYDALALVDFLEGDEMRDEDE